MKHILFICTIFIAFGCDKELHKTFNLSGSVNILDADSNVVKIDEKTKVYLSRGDDDFYEYESTIVDGKYVFENLDQKDNNNTDLTYRIYCKQGDLEFTAKVNFKQSTDLLKNIILKPSEMNTQIEFEVLDANNNNPVQNYQIHIFNNSTLFKSARDSIDKGSIAIQGSFANLTTDKYGKAKFSISLKGSVSYLAFPPKSFPYTKVDSGMLSAIMFKKIVYAH